MGIDVTGFVAINQAIKYCSNKHKFLTIGRQRWDLPSGSPVHERVFCEYNIKKCGFNTVHSIDYSAYEGATIVHNLNKPVEIDEKYDFIFDGGSTEHMFNIPQVLENIINLLEVGGVYCSVTVNNNFSGHGIYQFSPELFHCSFTKKYGMEVKEMYLAIEGSGNGWIDVWNNKYNDGIDRTTMNFNSTAPVYVVVIAQKISNQRNSLIDDPPNQHSYEVDWNK